MSPIYVKEDKSFEEQFPSLKGKYEGVKFIQTWAYILQEHCLDKQRVKEAIVKCFKQHEVNIHNFNIGKSKELPMDLLPMLIRELGDE